VIAAATAPKPTCTNGSLIVEDEGFVASNIQTQLLERGHAVTGVYASGEDALQVMAANNPVDPHGHPHQGQSVQRGAPSVDRSSFLGYRAAFLNAAKNSCASQPGDPVLLLLWRPAAADCGNMMLLR
jgi:hypothetical protein